MYTHKTHLVRSDASLSFQYLRNFNWNHIYTYSVTFISVIITKLMYNLRIMWFSDFGLICTMKQFCVAGINYNKSSYPW
jgi:hypothetical protein